MPGQSSHGKRLSAKEYERKVAELYTDVPPVPSREQERKVRRRELDLTIDHRLGVAFPDERRAALWEVQEKVERRRGKLVLRYLIRTLVPGSVQRGSTRLADFLVSEYSKVLNQEELDRFLSDEDPSGPNASPGSDRSPAA
jgi:hypothetical protein